MFLKCFICISRNIKTISSFLRKKYARKNRQKCVCPSKRLNPLPRQNKTSTSPTVPLHYLKRSWNSIATLASRIGLYPIRGDLGTSTEYNEYINIPHAQFQCPVYMYYKYISRRKNKNNCLKNNLQIDIVARRGLKAAIMFMVPYKSATLVCISRPTRQLITLTPISKLCWLIYFPIPQLLANTLMRFYL